MKLTKAHPLDECVCGDYRRDHVDHVGPCKLNYAHLKPCEPDCERFRLSRAFTEDRSAQTRPVGLEGNWYWHAPYERDGFTIQTGTHYPGKDVMLHVHKGDKLVFSERYFDHVWRGHCSGMLLIKPVLERLAQTESEPS